MPSTYSARASVYVSSSVLSAILSSSHLRTMSPLKGGRSADKKPQFGKKKDRHAHYTLTPNTKMQ
jgi:hypothetical protein